MDQLTDKRVCSDEIGTKREFVVTVSKQKLQYCGHIIEARNLCTHILDRRLEGRWTRGTRRRKTRVQEQSVQPWLGIGTSGKQ